MQPLTGGIYLTKELPKSQENSVSISKLFPATVGLLGQLEKALPWE